MEESRLIRRLASFTPAAKRDLIQKALSIGEEEADRMLRKICEILQHEEEMLQYLHRQKEIDQALGEEIDRIKMRGFGHKNRAESQKHRTIRLHRIEIRQIREAGGTWKDVATYLKKTYKIKASWVWIRHVFEEK